MMRETADGSDWLYWWKLGQGRPRSPPVRASRQPISKPSLKSPFTQEVFWLSSVPKPLSQTVPVGKPKCDIIPCMTAMELECTGRPVSLLLIYTPTTSNYLMWKMSLNEWMYTGAAWWTQSLPYYADFDCHNHRDITLFTELWRWKPWKYEWRSVVYV